MCKYAHTTYVNMYEYILMTYTRHTYMNTHNIYNITWLCAHICLHTTYFLQPLSSSLQFYQRGTASHRLPQHQKADGTSRSHRKVNNHMSGHRTDPPKAKLPLVYHRDLCAHSVGATVLGFPQVYNNILSHWSCEPTAKQT